MATVKGYTDLKQSKKLAEILPLESADHFHIIGHLHTDGPRYEVIRSRNEVVETDKYWPCWSLAALFDVLPILDNRSPVIPKTFDGKYRVTYHSTAYEKAILTNDYDNPVDACVAMIEKLNEFNLL